MEAALRTVYEKVTGRVLEELDFTDVRGMDGLKEATIDLDGTIVKVAAAHTLGNARALMDEVAAGTSPYHFIEIMACPGGCIGGGGQPITPATCKESNGWKPSMSKTAAKLCANPMITTRSRCSIQTSCRKPWGTDLMNCCTPNTV
jgi:iron only hydrogenase large subunit-like protein